MIVTRHECKSYTETVSIVTVEQNDDSNRKKRPRNAILKHQLYADFEAALRKEEWKGEPLFRKVKKDTIAKLPVLRFAGQINMVDTAETLDAAIEALQQEPILGLDTETRPRFTKGVCFPVTLLQLSSHDAAYLFALPFFGTRGKPALPASLCALLSNPDILKVGVGITTDMEKLKELPRKGPLQPRGILDLSHVTSRCGLAEVGLRGLCALLMGQNLAKTEQLSRWDKFPLSPQQQHYAALDAWAGYAVYHQLVRRDIPALELAHAQRCQARDQALQTLLESTPAEVEED